MAALRAAGHVGEGLVPPLPPDVAFERRMSEEALALVAEWRAAAAATNRAEAAESLVRAHPSVPMFQETLGLALVAGGDLAGAADAFGRASDIGYNMVFANRMLARCHAAAGDVPAAIDRAEAAFLAGTDDPATRRELSRLLLETGIAMSAAGETREARACIDRVLLLEPSNVSARLESAKLLLRSARTNDARRELRLVVRDAPGFAPASALLKALDAPAAQSD